MGTCVGVIGLDPREGMFHSWTDSSFTPPNKQHAPTDSGLGDDGRRWIPRTQVLTARHSALQGVSRVCIAFALISSVVFRECTRSIVLELDKPRSGYVVHNMLLVQQCTGIRTPLKCFRQDTDLGSYRQLHTKHKVAAESVPLG